MINFILGTILGTLIGITLMCIMQISKKEEQNDNNTRWQNHIKGGIDMEIEVGEHIRTNEGVIGKIKRIEFDKIDKSLKWYVFDRKRQNMDIVDEVYINKPYITKHSKNIIDLIEVGDILEIWFPIKHIIRKIFVDEYFKDSLVLEGIVKERIILKSILTKEQFEQNCYKLEE